MCRDKFKNVDNQYNDSIFWEGLEIMFRYCDWEFEEAIYRKMYFNTKFEAQKYLKAFIKIFTQSTQKKQK